MAGLTALYRAPVLGAREIKIDGLQQLGAAQAGRPAQHRDKVAFQGPNPEPLVDLLRGELPFFQEFFDQGIVAFRGKIEQIAVQRLHFIFQVVGDGARFLFAPPPDAR